MKQKSSLRRKNLVEILKEVRELKLEIGDILENVIYNSNNRIYQMENPDYNFSNLYFKIFKEQELPPITHGTLEDIDTIAKNPKIVKFIEELECFRQSRAKSKNVDIVGRNKKSIEFVTKVRDYENISYEENKAFMPTKEIKAVFVPEFKLDIVNIHKNEYFWESEEHDKFINFLIVYGKKFPIISKKMNKSIADCVEYYYNIKDTIDEQFLNKINAIRFEDNEVEIKKESLVKRPKRGRMSNSSLDLYVEQNFTESDKNNFITLYEISGNNFKEYVEKFEGKSIKDLKILENYYKKMKRESEKQSIQEKNVLEEKVVSKKKAKKELKPKKQIVIIKKEKKEKNLNQVSEVLKSWTINERKVFALYYPYVGKNWMSMSNYIPTKKICDFRLYFRVYFKNLSSYEKVLEESLNSYDFDNKFFVRFGTSTCSSPKNELASKNENELKSIYLNTAGEVFVNTEEKLEIESGELEL